MLENRTNSKPVSVYIAALPTSLSASHSLSLAPARQCSSSPHELTDRGPDTRLGTLSQEGHAHGRDVGDDELDRALQREGEMRERGVEGDRAERACTPLRRQSSTWTRPRGTRSRRRRPRR
jgi:hypothetical protein